MNEEDKMAALNAIEEPFARVTTGIVSGCVGAVDGLALRVRRAHGRSQVKKQERGPWTTQHPSTTAKTSTP